MEPPSRRLARALFAVLLVLSAGAVASSYATAQPNVAQVQSQAASPAVPDGPAAGSAVPPRGNSGSGATGDALWRERRGGSAIPGNPDVLDDRTDGTTVDPDEHSPANLTVVATQGFYASDETAELVAFDESGDVTFYDDRYRVYFDVDPAEERPYIVEYQASRHLDGAACANVSTERCTYNVFERVNLTTGEREEVYGEVTPKIYSGRWHDVDRINDSHVVVADILRDSIRVVNATSEETTWEWRAAAHFDPAVGGAEGDWTHINDVEVLADGRFMVSVRNMDRVVFVEPGEGVDPDWTLGEEDNYEVLYEQHNPDYIPADRGGPAIPVADSENGRVLEYQRVDPETGETTTADDGEWRLSWGWRDSRLQWPRDADRLPSGNTLVTDTHGARVVEVEPDGTIAWSVTVGMPYEAERLDTGDESAGGHSMRAVRDGDPVADPEASSLLPLGDSQSPDALPGASVTHPDRGVVEAVWMTLKDLTPSLVANGLLYAAPSWVRFTDLAFGFFAVGTALSWAGTELYWSPYSLRASLRALVPGDRP